jgi:hypothetical protein
MWKRPLSLNISWDIGFLGKVIRNRGMLAWEDPSAEERRVDVICFTLMTSNPRPTKPSEMSSAGVLIGRCLITALIGFWDLGWKV